MEIIFSSISGIFDLATSGIFDPAIYEIFDPAIYEIFDPVTPVKQHNLKHYPKTNPHNT